MNTSYFPPFAILKEGLRISDDGSAVTMSRDLFNKLIASAVRSEFDPVWYRRENPDIAAAVAAGNPIDELAHFAEAGYEEGRRGAYWEVDEAWYLETNRDVAEAVEAGDFMDGEAHFNETGYFEGRAGDADMEAEIEMWFNVILSSQKLRGAKERAGAESREPSLNAANAIP
jgi:hypothetical protein